jgi:hypothetical protein
MVLERQQEIFEYLQIGYQSAPGKDHSDATADNAQFAAATGGQRLAKKPDFTGGERLQAKEPMNELRVQILAGRTNDQNFSGRERAIEWNAIDNLDRSGP